MAQIVNRGAVKIVVPQPVIGMVAALVLLAQLVRPHLIPALLIFVLGVVFLALLKRFGYLRYQLAALQAVPVVGAAEIVVRCLAGLGAYRATVKKQKAALGADCRTVRDVDPAAQGVKLCALSAYVFGHCISPLRRRIWGDSRRLAIDLSHTKLDLDQTRL